RKKKEKRERKGPPPGHGSNLAPRRGSEGRKRAPGEELGPAPPITRKYLHCPPSTSRSQAGLSRSCWCEVHHRRKLCRCGAVGRGYMPDGGDVCASGGWREQGHSRDLLQRQEWKQ